MKLCAGERTYLMADNICGFQGKWKVKNEGLKLKYKEVHPLFYLMPCVYSSCDPKSRASSLLSSRTFFFCAKSFGLLFRLSVHAQLCVSRQRTLQSTLMKYNMSMSTERTTVSCHCNSSHPWTLLVFSRFRLTVSYIVILTVQV